MRRNIIAGLSLAMIIGLSGCGGGGGDAPVVSGGGDVNNMATTNKVVSTVTVASGNDQTATVGTELPNPLVAVIKNSEGQLIAGQTVNFRVVTGGGSVFAGAATSDASGVVRERWTLGTGAGDQKVEVRAVDSSGAAVVFATFTATATAGAPQTVNITSGNTQSATQNLSLPLPIIVTVKDANGNPIAGVPVMFTANNRGSSSPLSVNTNATGEALTIWTLGQTLGTQTLNAVVTGLPPAIFSATSLIVPGVVQTFILVSGNGQIAQQAQTLPTPIRVRVNDTYGNPAAGVPVTFTANNGGSSSPGSAITDAAGAASTMWTLGVTIGMQYLTANVTGLTSLTFGAQATQAPLGTAKNIVKISGDGQTVQQHLLLPLPLQVLVTDALSNPVPGTQVIFSAPNSNSIYNNPITAITDSTGKASWQGYFHAAGQHQVNVSVTGISTALFSVNATVSNHPYDGLYLGTIFDFTIVNGVSPYSDTYGSMKSTFNELDGVLSGSVGGVISEHIFTGTLVIDSLQRATGAGTQTERFGYIGTWTCVRQ